MIILIALAIVATLVFESDAFIRRSAVQRADDVLGGCAELTGVDLDLGRFPVTVRALRGHLDGITVAADAVDVSDVRLRDLRGHVGQARYSILGGFDDVTVHRTAVSLTLEERDLTNLLEALDLPATAHVDDHGVEVRLDDVATPIRLDIAAQGGAAVIALQGDLANLLDIRIDLPGVEVEHVTPAPGELRIRATVNGPPRTISCDAEDTIDRELTALARLGEALAPG